MKNLYLHHHLGLGDSIICNAIVRHYCKIYENVFLFVKNKYLPTISFMYRDLNNIKFIIIKEGSDLNYELNYSRSFTPLNPNSDYIEIGFDYLNTSDRQFDKAFYRQAGIDFSKRFEDFHVERDLEREKKLFNSLNIKENEYIFVCNLSSTGKVDINLNKSDNKKIVYLEQLTENMFDWVYTAMNSYKLYAVDSAFSCMIDSFDLKIPLYIQSRNNLFVIQKNNWIKI